KNAPPPSARTRGTMKTSVDGLLSATNCHLSDAQTRRCCGASKFEIRSDEFNIVQHVRQVAGNGHFRYGEGQLAVANPQARRAAGVIASYDVDSEAHQFGDVKAIGNPFENLFHRLGAGFHIEVPVADACVPGD